MNRVGAVCYSFQYSIGLFSYNQREGERFDVFKFVEATRDAGGECAQIFYSMLDDLSDDDLKRLEAHGKDLDVLLEIHGGTALRPDYEKTIHKAAAAGVKVLGCSFGMMERPDKIATLKEWDEHVEKCRHRLKEIADIAKPLGVTIGVENHLDFTIQELHDLIKECDASNVGVIFDVGNPIGTLDDPLEAADLLGPYTVATHYKDFAVEEVTRGFVMTMVPLGCGSLQLPEITKRLLKHVSPDIGFAIEMMNGQQLKINWLEDRFWAPFRGASAQQVAATLRHIRGKSIDIAEYLPVDEVDKLPHDERLKLERDRIARCISYLKGLLE
ncbi:MAG: sugar phosphate isomerase/epimerase [Planctomycetes bacterium]|nr:sugar phosphate isomerase/epimerase [Planctomycetota bacterium]